MARLTQLQYTNHAVTWTPGNVTKMSPIDGDGGDFSGQVGGGKRQNPVIDDVVVVVVVLTFVVVAGSGRR